MKHTNMDAHISAEEMIESFAHHCNHESGGASYRLTPKGQVMVTAYLTASNPDELIQLAEIFSAAAEAWEQS
jgi:hypothetical protein